MISKVCTKCNSEKLFTEFNKDKNMKSGYKSKCRLCLKSEYNSEYHKQYIIKNTEKVSERKKKSYHKKKEVYLQKNKEYRMKNREDYLSKGKKYYQNNKEKLLARSKIYRQENRAVIHKKKLARKKDRLKRDVIFKLKDRIRYRTYSILKSKNLSKKLSCNEYLGCTGSELKAHLERQFDSIMNWDNYGTYWVIDHIIPLSLAKTHEEVYSLSSYKNLQPLEKKANSLKSDKLDMNYKKLFSITDLGICTLLTIQNEDLLKRNFKGDKNV